MHALPSPHLCHVQVTRLRFAPRHAESWNLLVDMVRFNLMTADW